MVVDWVEMEVVVEWVRLVEEVEVWIGVQELGYGDEVGQGCRPAAGGVDGVDGEGVIGGRRCDGSNEETPSRRDRTPATTATMRHQPVHPPHHRPSSPPPPPIITNGRSRRIHHEGSIFLSNPIVSDPRFDVNSGDTKVFFLKVFFLANIRPLMASRDDDDGDRRHDGQATAARSLGSSAVTPVVSDHDGELANDGLEQMGFGLAEKSRWLAEADRGWRRAADAGGGLATGCRHWPTWRTSRGRGSGRSRSPTERRGSRWRSVHGLNTGWNGLNVGCERDGPPEAACQWQAMPLMQPHLPHEARCPQLRMATCCLH
ncbi:hypothetical protein ACLOJK_038820 [Asimina triloba]